MAESLSQDILGQGPGSARKLCGFEQSHLTSQSPSFPIYEIWILTVDI